MSCGALCDLPLVSQPSCNVGLAAFTWFAAVADFLPSALGGFARSAFGRSSYLYAYPNARGRCCVVGLDLARAPGVVAVGRVKTLQDLGSAVDDDAFLRHAPS